MAKLKSTRNQIKALPEYGALIDIMINETATIVNDYIAQYVGIISAKDKNGQAIYLNKDRVHLYQTYQELAFYDLYAEVERDPHVQSVMGSAKLNVAGMKWDVVTYQGKKEKKPSGRNEEIADFVREILKGVGYFPQHLYNLMGALGMGFAVSEIIWEIKDSRIQIKEILNRPQRRFQFDAVDRSLRLRSQTDPYFGTVLPDKKFIVHRCSAQWDVPFGDALDQSLYWMWLFKKTAIKFWMQHLQVGAASVPIVKYPANANAALKAEALAIAQQIRNGAYGRLPDNFEILWAESTKGSINAETYHIFLRMCNDEISKCVNGQSLTTEAGSDGGKGTQALGEVHQGTQSARDIFRAEGLSSTINKTLVKWLVDFNYANVDGYPEMRFDLEEPDDLEIESRIVKNISDAGYMIDEEELSEKFNYTISKKEIPVPLKQDIPIMGTIGEEGDEKEIEEAKKIEEDTDKKEFAELSAQMGYIQDKLDKQQPIINITTPPVTVNQAPITVNTPDVVVNNAPAQVRVYPANVNVTTPDIKLSPVINESPINLSMTMPESSGKYILTKDSSGKTTIVKEK
jgi:phage gp29-like protein